MSENPAEPVQPEVPQDIPATDPIITPDTPPTEITPAEPEHTPTPEEPPVKEPVEPSPEPPIEERPVPEGDKPVESLPVGSVQERAVTLVSKIADEEVRLLLMSALADKKAFSKDSDLRYRTHISSCIREMNRWIRTNIPASASFKTFMEGVNSYLLMVETQGIPSMWSAESANAPLDEIQARRAAMAIERAVQNMDFDENDPEAVDNESYGIAKQALIASLYQYAQDVRTGKIK